MNSSWSEASLVAASVKYNPPWKCDGSFKHHPVPITVPNHIPLVPPAYLVLGQLAVISRRNHVMSVTLHLQGAQNEIKLKKDPTARQGHFLALSR